jgi:Flp pilus assembly protein TadD
MKQTSCQEKECLLPHPDKLHLEAAEGWLMLGDVQEAGIELRRIAPENQEHPQVLEIEWRKCDAAGELETAWLISRRLCEVAPDQASVWICQANSLRRHKGAQSASELLMAIAPRFPNEPVIRYNIACYQAQLSNWQEACKWLLRSFDLETGDNLKIIALIDPDLRPLWEALGDACIIVVEEEASSDEEEDTDPFGN